MKTDTPETDAAWQLAKEQTDTNDAPVWDAVATDMRDKAQELERERDAARAECAWRPIETAPKDGTPIDLWCNGERLANYKRVERSPTNVFYDPVYAGIVCVRDATHWMPIPTAPKP